MIEIIKLMYRDKDIDIRNGGLPRAHDSWRYSDLARLEIRRYQ
jgi:hypothetical protein